MGKSLVVYARMAGPNTFWDYYVTRKTDFKSQWGAVCPTIIKGFEDNLVLNPNIYFDIPQDGANAWLSIDIQFKHPRENLMRHCQASKVNQLLNVMQLALDSKIKVFEKLVMLRIKYLHY